jgi:iron complex outermembrane receptor protein
MKVNNRLRVMIGIGAIVSAAGAQTANLQAAVPNEAKTGDGADQLQDIIVTAQRRPEGVQHAALAIDVVTPAALSLAGASHATDIANLVPALQISESGNAQQSLYLRSVGTFTANSYSDPAVAFNVDGVAIGRPSSMTGVLYDLDRVEVLKGPQGTLYGRNATGGAINIVPNLPKLAETSGTVALTAGNYGEVHPEAALNLALTDSSAARLALTYTKHNAYQTDGTGDAKNYAGRAQYLYQVSDALSVRVAGDYAHDGGHGAQGTLVALQNPFTGAFTASPLSRDVGNQDPRVSALFAKQYSFLSGRFFGPIDGAPNTDNNFWGVLSEIIWHSPIGTLTVLPSHRESKLTDFTTAFGFGSLAAERDRQSSVEVRLASENEGPVRWLVGGYYFHENIDAVYQFDQQALSPIQNFKTGTLSKATFARVTFAPIDEFRISGGVRYTDDRKTFDGVSQVLLNVCGTSTPIPACPTSPLMPAASSFASLSSQLHLFPIFPNALYGSTLPGAAGSVFPLINIPIDDTQKFTKITWHAGLEYDVAKDSLLYANWDSGYHAGGFAFAVIKPTYAPEFLSAYSVGSKNRFLNRTLQVNLEAFYWKYTNQQIPHGGTDINGTYVFYTDNAGSSTIKGAEISLKYLLTPHTVVNIDAQYLSAVYDSFTFQTPAGGTNAAPVTACPFSQTNATHYTINCAGKTALQSPKWTGNIGIQQTVEWGDYSLMGELSAHAQTASIVGFEMIPSEVQKTYAQANLSVTLLPSKAQWSVVAFVNNITDKRPYGTAYYDSTMGVIGASVGAPRTAGVRVGYKF